MFNSCQLEMLAHERQRDLERALRHRALIAAATPASKRFRLVRWSMQHLFRRHETPTTAVAAAQHA
jgi:hypothetical protein